MVLNVAGCGWQYRGGVAMTTHCTPPHRHCMKNLRPLKNTIDSHISVEMNELKLQRKMSRVVLTVDFRSALAWVNYLFSHISNRILSLRFSCIFR